MAILDAHEHHIAYHRFSLRVLDIRVDGELLGNSFAPFDASSEKISSTICEECYAGTGGTTISCGEPEIAVRRHNGLIHWFLIGDRFNDQRMSDLPLDTVWSFPFEHYEQQLGGSSSALPGFSSADIRRILDRKMVYPRSLGLFTIPDLNDDPQGRRLLDFLASFVKSDDLEACKAPSIVHSITIGIDCPGTPLTVIEVGLAESVIALRLVDHPSFPVWLTSGAIHHYLASIALQTM